MHKPISSLIRASDRDALNERSEWTGENATPAARFQGAATADKLFVAERGARLSFGLRGA